MTEIHNAHGPIHTGDGDLYSIVQVLTGMKERNPRLVPEYDLKWLDRRFVAPPNLSAARERLHEHRAVFLTGDPGSGRVTAAKMLLHELRDQAGPFTPLPEEDRLSPQDVPAQGRLLLDLSHTDTATANARIAELSTLRAILPERAAYLVVVLPSTIDPQADLDVLQHTVRTGKPRGDVVLRRHLLAEGIRLSNDDIALPALKAHIDGPMRDIGGLAISVRQAADEQPHASTAEWLMDAIDVIDRTAEVAEQIHERPSLRDRAVLLAAAMCPRATKDAVFFAAQKLLAVVGPPVGERPRLEQDGYLKQLTDLGIEVEEERVRFPSFKYDHTVRVHFWDNYPDLRESFCKWTDELLNLQLLSIEEREAMLDRFLEQALRTNCASEVVKLLNLWANPDDRNRKPNLRFATQALIAGLADDDNGWRFRRLVYDWSTRKDLPPHIGPLVVRMCAEVIAPAFPEQAVVRLHHRARNEGPNALEPTAIDTLCELTTGDPILLRFLLQRLTDGNQILRSPVDQALFLCLCGSPSLTDTHNRTQPLAANRTVRAQLVRGWYTLLRHNQDSMSRAVRHMLASAAGSPNPQLLLHILVDAADRDVHVLAKLYVLARDWGHTTTPRSNMLRLLTPLIDAAQGIHPPSVPPGYGATTMTKQNRILLAGLAAAFAIPLIVGLLLHWPVWVTAPLLVAVLAGIGWKLSRPTYTVADHVDELLNRAGFAPGNPIRDLTASRLADLIEASGNPLVASEIRREFDNQRP